MQSQQDICFPNELLRYIFKFLDNDSRKNTRLVCKLFDNILLSMGFKNIFIKSKYDEQMLMPLIDRGLNLALSNIKISDRYQKNEFVEKLAGVHTINLGWCTQLSDKAIMALAGVHTIDLGYCTQLSDKAIMALAGVHTINLRSCRQLSDEAIMALAGVHTIDLYGCRQITDKAIIFLKKYGACVYK
jgi:hypothetical protein